MQSRGTDLPELMSDTDYQLRKRRRSEALLAACTLIWGSTFVVQKIALLSISPLLFAAIRFSFATLILTAIFWKQIRTIDKSALQKGIALGLLLGFGFAAQNVGLKFTTASKSAFITGMTVVFTPLMQFIIERRPPTIGNILGVGSVTAGLFFLTSPQGSEFNLGDGLTLVCAVLFAIYIVYLDVVSNEVSIAHLVYLQIVTTGALCLFLALAFEPVYFVPSVGLLVSLAYLTVFATLLTTYVQTRFQRDTTPTRAAIILSLEPVIAATSAYFILGEMLGVIGVLGGALILAGLLVSELSDGIPVLSRPLLLSEAHTNRRSSS
jgi:drug/metabolite transporter (DMT)-like permease